MSQQADIQKGIPRKRHGFLDPSFSALSNIFHISTNLLPFSWTYDVFCKMLLLQFDLAENDKQTLLDKLFCYMKCSFVPNCW